jgi:hypothetical protein
MLPPRTRRGDDTVTLWDRALAEPWNSRGLVGYLVGLVEQVVPGMFQPFQPFPYYSFLFLFFLTVMLNFRRFSA